MRTSILRMAVLYAVTTVAAAAADGPSEHASSAVMLGSQHCTSCHRGGEQAQRQLARLRGESPGNGVLIALDEADVWERHDRHAHSLELMRSKRAQAIGRRLGIPDVLHEASCMNCHGQIEARQGERLERVRPIGCETCHGAAGPIDNPVSYYVEHQIPARWRPMDPLLKTKKGMINVRDVVTRTRLCLSCHVGSVAQGRVVTHDMYAAGHPLLPEIDPLEWLDAMPPHWTPVEKKKLTFQHAAEWLQANFGVPVEQHDDFFRHHRTRQAVAAAQTAQSVHAELVGRLAGSGRVEWSVLRCGQCHHAVERPPSERASGVIRQASGSGGLPLPRFLEPSFISVAAESGLVPKDAVDRVAQLRLALVRSPYGIGEPVAEQSAELARLLARSAAEQVEKPWTNSDVERLAGELLQLGSSQHLPWETQRRVAWLLRHALDDLASAPPQSTPVWSDALKHLARAARLDLPRPMPDFASSTPGRQATGAHGLGESWIIDVLENTSGKQSATVRSAFLQVQQAFAGQRPGPAKAPGR